MKNIILCENNSIADITSKHEKMENNELIDQWRKGLRIKHVAHSIAFSHYSSIDKIIGLISTLLSAMVATTIFASISKSQNASLLIIAGIISILATLSSSDVFGMYFRGLCQNMCCS